MSSPAPSRTHRPSLACPEDLGVHPKVPTLGDRPHSAKAQAISDTEGHRASSNIGHLEKTGEGAVLALTTSKRNKRKVPLAAPRPFRKRALTETGTAARGLGLRAPYLAFTTCS